IASDQCAPDEECDAATHACHSRCASGRTRCGTSCLDTTSDPLHCGGCDHACQTGETCSGSHCQPSADCHSVPCTGLTYCDLTTGQCLPGCMRDEQCTGPHQHCDEAARNCACVAGYHACGECASDLSLATCGTSCTPCPAAPAHGSATCDGTSCDFVCDDGY